MNQRSASNCYKCGSGFTLAPAPAPEVKPAPAILDHQLVHPVLSDIVIAKEHTPVPEPLAQQVDATAASKAGAVTGSERSWWFASFVIFLATIGISGYYYFEQSAAVPKPQAATPADSRVSATPIADGAAPSTVTPQNGAVPAPSDTTATPVAGASGLDTALALAPPEADPAVTVPPPSPTVAQTTTRQDPPPLVKDCPPAVAALGFCNPGTKLEEQ